MEQLETRPAIYVSNSIPGDGNCFFHAFARALDSPGITGPMAREGALAWLREHLDFLDDFVVEEYPGQERAQRLWGYICKMQSHNEYADNIMVEATGRAYRRRIGVLKKLENDGGYNWSMWGPDFPGHKVIGLYLRAEHYENLATFSDVIPGG